MGAPEVFTASRAEMRWTERNARKFRAAVVIREHSAYAPARMRTLERAPRTGALASLFTILALLCACDVTKPRSAPRRPLNVLLVVADDLGWGELGCYGQMRIRTPTLDALAAQGVRFTQAYSGAPVCAPSRCSLLTGMHTGHSAIRDNRELQPEGQEPLPRDTVTLANLLAQRGYATAAIGKWGLGPPDSEGDPAQHGFERFFGYYCQRHAHSYYPQWLYRDGERIELPGNVKGRSTGASYSPDLMREEALGFLREHGERPFFLYYAATLPHVALQVPADSLAEYAGAFPETPYDGKQGYLTHPTPRAAYAAMITRLDRDVGAILAEIERLGQRENTLVVFTSDNGSTWAGGVDAAFFASTGGLRGHKGQLFEGGIRVPLIVHWPGRTLVASESSFPCAGWDLMPTILEACGAPVPAGIDGLSLVPVLDGSGPAPARDYLYWEHADGGGWQAVRLGDWKAVRRNTKRNIPGAIEVFDLVGDPGETRNLAAQQPELVKRAKQAFATRSEARIADWNFPPAR